MANLSMHLDKREHRQWAWRITVSDLPSLLQHVQKVLDLPHNQDCDSIVEMVATIELLQPLEAFKSPSLHMQCPSCQGWFVTGGQLPMKAIDSH
jgi:hypothetical protein